MPVKEVALTVVALGKLLQKFPSLHDMLSRDSSDLPLRLPRDDPKSI